MRIGLGLGLGMRRSGQLPGSRFLLSENHDPA